MDKQCWLCISSVDAYIVGYSRCKWRRYKLVEQLFAKSCKCFKIDRKMQELGIKADI